MGWFFIPLDVDVNGWNIKSDEFLKILPPFPWNYRKFAWYGLMLGPSRVISDFANVPDAE